MRLTVAGAWRLVLTVEIGVAVPFASPHAIIGTATGASEAQGDSGEKEKYLDDIGWELHWENPFSLVALRGMNHEFTPPFLRRDAW